MIEEWRRFAAAMMRSKDVDPMYPVLRAMNEADNFPPDSDQALIRSLVFVAFYHIGASETFIRLGGLADLPNELLPPYLPTGIERRGLRAPMPMRQHLKDLIPDKIADYGSLAGWLRFASGRPTQGTELLDPRERWTATRRMLEGVYNNGRWASYKTAEILAEVHDWSLEAPDAGHTFSTGPRDGLRLLQPDVPEGNSPEVIAELDRRTAAIQRDLWAHGIPAPVCEVETLLCNYHSWKRGHYYVGHDIDEMLQRALWAREPIRGAILAARRRSLPERYLGEVQGWSGIRKDMMGAAA